MSTQVSKLPPELVLIILDYLWNDHHSLSSCSLVCKAWVSPCRTYLMENHSINTSKARTPLNPAILGQFTRKLIISGHRMSTSTSSWPEEAQHFTRVTSFYLTSTSVDHSLQSRIPATFTLVNHLELHSVSFESLEGLVGFVCSFPVLESLSLAKLKWYHGAPQQEQEQVLPSPSLQPSRRLRSFSIQSTWLDPILSWINLLKPLPKFSTFRVDTLAFPESIGEIGRTINLLGESLVHLTLVVLSRGNAAAGSINLKNNPNLRTLEVFFSTSIRFLVDILESHTPTTTTNNNITGIEKITFSLSSLMEDTSNWRDLDRVLVDMHSRQPPEGRKLKQFIYRGEAVRSWPENPQDMEDFERDSMPESGKLGIVRRVPRWREVRQVEEGFPALARLRKTDLLYVL